MADRPLSPGQVAHIFGVTVATVGAWADTGRLKSFRTPGGQRRFRPEDVDDFLAEQARLEQARRLAEAKASA